jgi:ATP-binding cassette subfamily C (CFTR/MRP) protein 1
VLLILWSNPSASTERTRTTIPSATFALIDVVVFSVLSPLEHNRSLRPSVLLNIYLFFSLLFDIVRIRTLWLIQQNAISALFTASCALKLIILMLESIEKKRYSESVGQTDYSPEETSSILSAGLFLWLNRLIRSGFKKTLSIEDLYPLHSNIRTATLQSKFQGNWNCCKLHQAR